MSLKFCANITMMFYEESSLLKRYALSKNAGFVGVECAFPYDFDKDELSKEKSSLGLQQVLINTFPGTSLGFAALKGKSSEYMESLKKSIAYCKALDCKRLHIMSGKVSQDCPGDEETLTENLRKSVQLLQEENIVGLIEPINPYSVPGYFLNNFETAVRIVESLGSPFLRLQLDIFHLQFLEGNLTNNIKRLIPITGHIQIAQVPDRHEPDSLGEINYEHVFKVIQDSGYDGWIGLEYNPKCGTENGLAWMKKVTP